MRLKTKLRLISLAMLAVAIAFVACAISNPTLGHTVTIGTFQFGVEQWRACYAAYLAVMVVLFGISFIVKEKEG